MPGCTFVLVRNFIDIVYIFYLHLLVFIFALAILHTANTYDGNTYYALTYFGNGMFDIAGICIQLDIPFINDFVLSPYKAYWRSWNDSCIRVCVLVCLNA